MATIRVTSALDRDGKSVVATGLAAALRAAGSTVRLTRLDDARTETARASDGNDAATFALLQGVRATAAPEAASTIQHDTDHLIVETAPTTALDAACTILVTRHGQADDYTLRSAIDEIQPSFLVLNAVPPDALNTAADIAARLNVPLLAALPQDRLLAAPSFASMAAAVGGELSGPAHLHNEAAEWLVVGSISAHSGINYFDNHPQAAVITRHDRIDVALSALNQNPACLILSGGVPQLPYVYERAESEEFALIVTPLDTATAAGRIGDLYTQTDFQGTRKLQRAVDLIADHAQLELLTQALSVPA